MQVILAGRAAHNMATPRKVHKIRDHERTRQLLLDIVGDILLVEGPGGLRTSEIAKRLGKDKSLIRYYFHSLANLKKTYIQKKDHWFSLFEQLHIPADASSAETKEILLDFLLKGLEYFTSDIGMQKVLLWQISENSPLMQAIAEWREEQSQALFLTVDQHFRGRESSIRAVIALITGGVYFMTLLAEMNSGSVCGINIKSDKGKEAVRNAIRCLIDSAWTKPGSKRRAS